MIRSAVKQATQCSACVAVALVALCGCAQDRAAVTDADIERYMDPVARSELREVALEALVELTQAPDAQVRANAIEAMIDVPARLEPLLPAALADENEGVRSVAAIVVGRCRMSELIENVVPMAADRSPHVRISALYALSRCEREPDLTPLAGYLLDHPNGSVRAYTAFVLSELGDPSAKGLLRQGAIDSAEVAPAAAAAVLRLQISEALVKLGDDEQLHPLRAALFPARPEDLELTALAAQMLGELGDEGSSGQLIMLTGQQDRNGRLMPPEVRLAATGALAKLGRPQGGFIAEEYVAHPDPTVRRQAAHVLGEIGGPESLARLHRLLDDPSALVRVSAGAGIVRATRAVE